MDPVSCLHLVTPLCFSECSDAGRAGHRAVNERETGVAGLSYNSQEVFPGSGCFISTCRGETKLGHCHC